jgi:hypothetical protein
MVPLFEQHPLAFILLIIATVECWQVFKVAAAKLVRRLTRNLPHRLPSA